MEDVTVLSVWINRTYNEGIADMINSNPLPRNISPAQLRWISAFEKLHTNDQMRMIIMQMLGVRFPTDGLEYLKEELERSA